MSSKGTGKDKGKGTPNTSRAHKHKRAFRPVDTGDVAPSSPPPDPTAASSVITEAPVVYSMAGRDLFGHYPGDEFIPPGVSDLYDQQGINPLTLVMVHVDKEVRPDKDCRVIPLLNSARLDADTKLCERYKTTTAVDPLYKQGLFKAVFTAEGITPMSVNWREKFAQFDDSKGEFYHHARNRLSHRLGKILRHEPVSVDTKGWAPLEQVLAYVGYRPQVSVLTECVLLNPKYRFQLCCVIRAPATWQPGMELPNGGLLTWYVRALQGHSNPKIDMSLATNRLVWDTRENFPALKGLRPVHCTNFPAARGIHGDQRLIPGGPQGSRNDVHFGFVLPRSMEEASPGAHVTRGVWLFLDLDKALWEGAEFGCSLNGVLLSRQPILASWFTMVNMKDGQYYPSRKQLKGIDLVAFKREQDRKNGIPLSGPVNAVDENLTFAVMDNPPVELEAGESRHSEDPAESLTERRMYTFLRHDNRVMSTDLWHLNLYFSRVEHKRLSPAEIRSIWDNLEVASTSAERYEDFRTTDISVTGESPSTNSADRKRRLAALVDTRTSLSTSELRAQKARENERARQTAISESRCCVCLCSIIRGEAHWECTKCNGALSHWSCWQKQDPQQQGKCPVCRQVTPAWAADYAQFGAKEAAKAYEEVAKVIQDVILDEGEMHQTKALQIEEVLGASRRFRKSEDPQAEVWLLENKVGLQILEDLYQVWLTSFHPEQPISINLESRDTERFPGDIGDYDPTASSSGSQLVIPREQKCATFPGVRAIRGKEMPPLHEDQPFEYFRSQHAEYHLIGGSQSCYTENVRVGPYQFIVGFDEDTSVLCDYLAEVTLVIPPVVTVAQDDPILRDNPQSKRGFLPPGNYKLTDCIVCPNAMMSIIADRLIENELALHYPLPAQEEAEMFRTACDGVFQYLLSQNVFTAEEAEVEGFAGVTDEDFQLSEALHLAQGQNISGDSRAEERAAQTASLVNPFIFGKLLSSAQRLAEECTSFEEERTAMETDGDPDFLAWRSTVVSGPLHACVQIESLDTIEEMMVDPQLRMPPRELLKGVTLSGVTNWVPTSPLKMSISQRLYPGVASTMHTFVSIDGVDFNLLSTVVVTILQQQDPVATGLQSTRYPERCLGYFTNNPLSACDQFVTWMREDPLVTRLLKGEHAQRTSLRSIEQFFMVHLIGTMDFNTRTPANMIRLHGYGLEGGRQPGLPFFCYWFVVCFLAVAVNRQWDYAHPAPMDDDWTFTAHTIEIETSYNLMCSLMWRAFETRTFEFIRLFYELWLRWKWLREPTFGPDFNNILTAPPDYNTCPATRASCDAPRTLTCKCGRDFLTGEQVCVSCNCDVLGVCRTVTPPEPVSQPADAMTDVQSPPVAAPPLVVTREQTIVDFLNLNPQSVEVLPPLEPETLLAMMRNQSQELELLCHRMSKEQLEVFVKRLAELPYTQTLAGDRLIMNRVVSISLMEKQRARTEQSDKYKSPIVNTSDDVPRGWGMHQRVLDLQSSADSIDIVIACWSVPWSGNAELARVMATKLLFEYSFPILILMDYRLPVTSEPHRQLVAEFRKKNQSLVVTDGGNAIRLRFNRLAPQVGVRTIFQSAPDRVTGLTYEIVHITFPLAPAVIDNDVKEQPLAFKEDAKGWHCRVCRATWEVDKEPRIVMLPGRYCSVCRDAHDPHGPVDERCPKGCGSMLFQGQLRSTSLRPHVDCCNEPVRPGVLSPESAVGARKQMEVLGKTSWTFCLFEFGNDSTDDSHRRETNLKLRAMLRNCLAYSVDAACGPALAALNVTDAGLPSLFGRKYGNPETCGDSISFQWYDSLLEKVATEEVDNWNSGKRLRRCNAPPDGGELVSGAAEESLFHDMQVVFTLHTPSLRSREDKEALERLIAQGCDYDAVARTRSTAMLMFHNSTSRHAQLGRVKTLQLLQEKLNPRRDEPIPDPASPPVEIRKQDKIRIVAVEDVYHYNDAASTNWPHQDGQVGRERMFSECADEMFYEGFLSLSYGPLDYNVTLVGSVNQEDVERIFSSFGDVSASWLHPLALRVRIYAQSNQRKRYGIAGDARTDKVRARQQREETEDDEPAPKAAKTQSKAGPIVLDLPPTPKAVASSSSRESWRPEATTSVVTDRWTPSLRERLPRPAAVPPLRNLDTSRSRTPVPRPHSGPPGAHQPRPIMGPPGAHEPRPRVGPPGVFPGKASGMNSGASSSAAPPGHHGCPRHRDPVDTCVECRALYYSRERARAKQPNVGDIRLSYPQGSFEAKAKAIQHDRMEEAKARPRWPNPPEPPPYRPPSLRSDHWDAWSDSSSSWRGWSYNWDEPPEPEIVNPRQWTVAHGTAGHKCDSNCPFWKRSDYKGRNEPW